MALNLLSVFLLLLIILMAVIFWAGARNAHKRDRLYKTALENNQKKLDLQTSRINIISRALPNLIGAMTDPNASDTWQTLALDEARALLWADGASYWRYHDPARELE